MMMGTRGSLPMSRTIDARPNLEMIEAEYQRWRQDPSQVDPSWRLFFEGFELGLSQEPAVAPDASQQTCIVHVINTYRRLGHLLARLDPLSDPPATVPQLELGALGFTEADLDKTFDTSFFLGLKQGTLRQLISALRETYSRTIGIEYMHISDPQI